MIFQRPIIGLDISERSIEMAEVVLRRARWAVKRADRVLLPAGIVERGEIKEPTALIEILQELHKKGKFSSRPNVILSYPDSQVFTSIVALPNNLGNKGLEKSVLFKARESLPLALDEAHFDFMQTSRSDTETYYVVSSSPKAQCETYQHVIQQAGMTPYIFDTQAFCAARGLGIEESKTPIAIVDIGSIHSVISLFDASGMQYNSYIEVGGGHISQQIASTLGISFEEAEKMKRSTGLAELVKAKIQNDPDREEEEEEEEVKSKSKKQKKSTKKKATKSKKKKAKTKKDKPSKPSVPQLFSVIDASLQPIVTDLQEGMRYYQEQNEKALNHVYIVGGGSKLNRLEEYLETKLNIDVSIGQIRKDVVKLPKDSALYLNAIGAGIRGLANKPQQEGLNFVKNKIKKV